MQSRRWIPARLLRILGLMALLIVSPSVSSRPAKPESSAKSIRAVVLDSSGAPIAGARISKLDLSASRLCPDPHVGTMENLYLAASPAFSPSDGEAEESAPGWSKRTGSDGRFEIPSTQEKDASELYLVTAEGFAPQLEKLDGTSPKVILDRGQRLRVRILNDRDQPVQDAQATLVPLTLCESAARAQKDLFVIGAHSDPEGAVAMRNVPGGVYALRLMAKGLLASNVAPLLVGEGHSEFTVHLPRTRTLRGALEIPPRASGSAGTVLAQWKDADGWPQWSQCRFASGESSFELDGLSYAANLLAWTESGLSSHVVAREEFNRPMALRSPTDLEGKLDEVVTADFLIVQPLFPATYPPYLLPGPFSVPVGSDHRFVVPSLPFAAERLRIIAPNYGESEVKLDEGVTDLGTVKIPRGHMIGGSIAWGGARPMESAEVQVLSDSHLICRARTTPEGRFACSAGESEVRGLHFQAFVGASEFRLVPLSEDPSGRLTPSAGGSIQLRVTRPRGVKGVRDLRLILGSVGDNAPQAQRTLYAHSPAALFSLTTADDGPVRITASYPGGEPKSAVALTVPPSASLRSASLVLPEGPTVLGTVLGAAARNPVTGAEVEIGHRTEFLVRAEVGQIIHSPAEGSWRFDEVPEGNYRLSASAPGYSSAVKTVSVPAETKGVSQEILLQRPGRLRGRILNLLEGSKATVSISARGGGANEIQGNVDSHGQFNFENLRPARYLVHLGLEKSSLGHVGRWTDVQVRPGETAEVEFDLSGGVTLSGRVYLGEKAVPKARILFAKRRTADSTFTNEEGQYSISLPLAGRYQVSLYWKQPSGNDVSETHDDLEVGDESSQSHDLHFSDGRIRGKVLDATGRPMADITVEALVPLSQLHAPEEPGDKRWGFCGSTTTPDAGTFDFTTLPAGEYKLQVQAQGFAKWESEPLQLARDQVLELPDIVLNPESPVRVRVVDPQGAPLRGVEVAVSLPTDFNDGFGYGTSDDNGEAVLKGMPPGIYTLTGTLRGWPPALRTEVKLPPEEKEPPPVLQFAPGGTLEILVVDKSGSPMAGIPPHIIDKEGRDLTDIYFYLADLAGSSYSTDDDGRLRYAAVAPGEYSVKAGTGKDADVRTVAIVTGQTTSVTLRSSEPEKP